MGICEYCKDDLSWCDCPRQCAKGNHMWDKASDRCIGCKITKEKLNALSREEGEQSKHEQEASL